MRALHRFEGGVSIYSGLARPSQSAHCNLTNTFPFIIDVYRNDKAVVSILPPSRRTYSSILLTARANIFPINHLCDANDDVNRVHYKPALDLNTYLGLKAATILRILSNSSTRSRRCIFLRTILEHSTII